ncbi:MAG TPA: hypothetical protein VJ742_09265, partial [Nitrososphaera sp.]|nr:hypothetical protein [Nitrososphaera sp.]
TVDRNPQVPGGFFITVCLDHPVARNEALLDEAISDIIARRWIRPNPRRRNARRKAEALTAETTPLHKQSLASTSKATAKARTKSTTQETTNANPKKGVPKADSANTP